MASATGAFNSLKDLLAHLSSLGAKDVVVYFYGSPLETGVSWCPDCAASAEMVKDASEKRRDNLEFLQCEVGGRESWKDPKNGFRGGDFSLNSVPTLLAFRLSGAGTRQQIHKFEEDQCLQQSNLSSLFTSQWI